MIVAKSRSRRREWKDITIIILSTWVVCLGTYIVSILTRSSTTQELSSFHVPPNIRSNFEYSTHPTNSVSQVTASRKSSFGRRVIYQCTCTGHSQHWSTNYWNVDLGRAKQWRLALQRIHQLVPDIETVELILKTNSNVSCEDRVVNDMERYGVPEAYEIIVSPWYNDGPCKRSDLNLLRLGVSEHVDVQWGDSSPSHLARRRGMIREMREWGELFDGKHTRCDPNNADLHISHSKRLMPHQRLTCNVIHVPEQVDWATLIANYRKRNESVQELLTARLTRVEAMSILKKKTEFAGLITQSTWKPFYPIDSLVRHALCRLLTEQYKPCELSVSWRGDVERLQQRFNLTTQFKHDTVPLYARYKFAIALNNALWEGYMTEKEINPFLAQSIAIVGAPDYKLMANAKRVIHCAIPRETLDDAERWARGESFMPFNTTPDDWSRDSSIQPIPYDINNDKDLIQFAANKFREALKPCILEIIRLDKDDDAYVNKLMEPYVLKYENSLFDGTYVASGLLHWLHGMGSPIMFGLESSIKNIQIDPQTQ